MEMGPGKCLDANLVGCPVNSSHNYWEPFSPQFITPGAKESA